MFATDSGYVIVDDFDNIWPETLASNRHRCWLKMGEVCGLSKAALLKRGFKCVRVSLRTEDFKR